MLKPEQVEAWVEDHFDRVTDEEFLSNLKRVMPEAEWEELMHSRARRRPGMAARLKLAIGKLLLSLRPKPPGPVRSK
jgi:hypothetical protein